VVGLVDGLAGALAPKGVNCREVADDFVYLFLLYSACTGGWSV
jgi:hypothetical protein